MKATIEKKLNKQRKTAVPVMPVPESKPEPVAIAPRIVRRGTCSTLSQKGGELGYEIGVDSRGDVHLRVVENSGAGSFSDEWVAFKAIQAAFDRAPKSEPVSAYMLHPLFRGMSSNCCYFCTAVLKSEGLLTPSEKRKKRFDRVDSAAWLADMRSRAEGRATDVAGEKGSKKSAAPKAVASKPKKSNKAAKT
jgi:hypothetical protein